MVKKIQKNQFTQEEMFELINDMSQIFGFKVYVAASPHSWCISPNKERAINVKSRIVEIETTDKLYASQKKAIARVLRGKFIKERKNETNPKEKIYEFSFMK